MKTLHCADPRPDPRPSLSLHVPSGVVLEIPLAEICAVDFNYPTRQLTVHTTTGRVYRSVGLY